MHLDLIPYTAPPVDANGSIQSAAPSPTTPAEIPDNCSQYSGPVSPPIVKTNYTYSSNITDTSTQPAAIIENQPVPGSLAPLKLGPKPSRITCPECGERFKSKMIYTANKKTHIFAATIALVGFPCCLCIIPYCVNNCKTGHHYCRNCDSFLGTYNPDQMISTIS